MYNLATAQEKLTALRQETTRRSQQERAGFHLGDRVWVPTGPTTRKKTWRVGTIVGGYEKFALIDLGKYCETFDWNQVRRSPPTHIEENDEDADSML